MISLGLAVLLLFQGSAAQPQATPTRRPSASSASAKAESEQRTRGKKLLAAAEAESAAIREAGMKSYAFVQLARAYAGFDRAKALDLLDQAFNAALTLPEDSKSKPRLQQQVLEAMAAVNPQHVDELLSQVPSDVRQGALLAMLDYYQGTKQIDRAMEMVTRIAGEGTFPFAAANKLIESLPAEITAEREQLFAAALAAYREQKPSFDSSVMGERDFANMVTRNWQSLPVAQVRDAIDVILEKTTAPEAGSLELTMFGQGGSLAFNSAYEWRLFQLLPVLRRIDEAAADDLLKKNQRVQAQLQRYPEGMQSWSDAYKDRAAVNGVVTTVRDSGSPRNGPVKVPPRVSQMLLMVERMNKVLREVKDHPNEALAQALAISDDNTRVRTLVLVARATQKNNTAVCKIALDKVVDQVDRVAPDEQVGVLIDAGRVYRDLKEIDGAKKVVERGAGIAEKLYKTDTDSDDPNKAVKAFWPSTNAWTNFARLAADVSPNAALRLVNEISDEEIRPVVRTALAAAWLGAPSGSTVILNETKAGVRTSAGRNDE